MKIIVTLLKSTVAAVKIVSSMSTIIANKELCLREDLTWKVSNHWGHMKQLYKNLKNISGLKT